MEHPEKTTQFLVILMVLVVLCAIALAAIPQFIHSRHSCCSNACVSNLRTLEGAIATWALENKKETNDVPTWSELIGSTKYIKDQPVCPQGGTYTLHRVDQKPTCTILDHTF